jgi:hypothetical protein
MTETWSAVPDGRAPVPPRATPDREQDCTLRTLERAGDSIVTLDELRAGGVAHPGQAIYELQLAGYRIERVAGRGHRLPRRNLGYRLEGRPEGGPGTAQLH